MSAVGPLNKALYSAFTGDAALALLLSGRKVYSGQADDGTEGTYIVLASDAEVDGEAFGRVGYRDEASFTIYHKTPAGQPVSKQPVHIVYAHVSRILGGALLEADGFRFVSGRAELTLVAVEPDGRTVMAPCVYRVQSYAASNVVTPITPGELEDI